MNRPPSARDPWWAEHQMTCGGTYTKIKEPENYGKTGKGDKKKDKNPSNEITKNSKPPSNKNPSNETSKNSKPPSSTTGDPFNIPTLLKCMNRPFFNCCILKIHKTSEHFILHF